MNDHALTEPVGSTDLICGICGMEFESEDDLDIHLPDCEAALDD